MSENLVIAVSADAARLEAISQAIRERDHPVRSFAGFDECLKALRESVQVHHACLVCPMRIGATSGLEFQFQLRQLPHATCIVFYDTPSSINEVVEVMRQGAVAVVEPSGDISLLSAYVEEGIERSRTQYVQEDRCRDTLERLRTLSVGEHQVLQGIMEGSLNKEIARQWKLSTRTIEQRRRDLFRKMDVQHPAMLVRRVIEAVQMPLSQDRFDERGKWLEAIRHDFLHPQLSRPAGFIAASWSLTDSPRQDRGNETRMARGHGSD